MRGGPPEIPATLWAVLDPSLLLLFPLPGFHRARLQQLEYLSRVLVHRCRSLLLERVQVLEKHVRLRRIPSYPLSRRPYAQIHVMQARMVLPWHTCTVLSRSLVNFFSKSARSCTARRRR